MEHKAEYDEKNNILFISYIGTVESKEDIDFILGCNMKEYEKRPNQKFWAIVDINQSKMINAKLISEFAKKDAPMSEKHLIRFCTVCSKPLMRIANMLYNTVTGKKNPIFKTKEEAVAWVLEQQKTYGKFARIEE